MVIFQVKVSMKEGTKLTRQQREIIVNAMRSWLAYHLPFSHLVDVEISNAHGEGMPV